MKELRVKVFEGPMAFRLCLRSGTKGRHSLRWCEEWFEPETVLQAAA
ncbi:hypothetical protein QO004_004024 [Rhizobium mesoamericanum]|nr:hypothetical protein [Rhizobium mesoamericanum]